MPKLDTRLLHDGEARTEGSVVGPIFQSATFLEAAGRAYDDIRYARLSNTPSHVAPRISSTGVRTRSSRASSRGSGSR